MEMVAAGHYNTCTSWMIEIVSSKMYRRQKAVANLRSLCCLTCFCHLPDTRYLPRKSTSYVVEHVYCVCRVKIKMEGGGGVPVLIYYEGHACNFVSIRYVFPCYVIMLHMWRLAFLTSTINDYQLTLFLRIEATTITTTTDKNRNMTSLTTIIIMTTMITNLTISTTTTNMTTIIATTTKTMTTTTCSP